MNIKRVLSITVVMIFFILLAACEQAVKEDVAYVTLDINPSVELIVSKDEIVLYTGALNNDAEVLLVDLALVGLNAKIVLDRIIEQALNLGFILPDEEDITINIDTLSISQELKEMILSRVREGVNEAFETRAIFGKAVEASFPQDLIDEATELGVSPALYRLIQTVLLQTDAYTIEELLELDIQTLIELLREGKRQNMLVVRTIRDEFMEERDAIRALYMPQIQALELQLEDPLADVEAIELEIEALKQEMLDLIKDLRIAFMESQKEAVQEIREQHQNRKELREDAMAAYLEALEASFPQDLIDEATELGVSPALYRLIQTVLLQTDAYTIEELLELDIQTLIELLREGKRQNMLVVRTIRDEFMEERDAIRALYMPQIQALELQLEDPLADVEAIELEIEALKQEMLDLIKDLRIAFMESQKEAVQEIREQHQNRKELREDAMAAYLEALEARKEALKDRLEAFKQRGRD